MDMDARTSTSAPAGSLARRLSTSGDQATRDASGIATLRRLEAERRRRLRLVFATLGALVLAAGVLSIAVGAHAIPVGRVVEILLSPGAAPLERDAVIVQAIRLPRTAATLLVGATLAVAGVLMQGLFRNPLADPGLLGVSSGAALAAAVVIVLGDRLFATALPAEVLPLAAFVGAGAATLLLAGAGRRGGRTDIAVILLAGLAFAALANAALGLLIFVADDRQLRDITFWTLGSFGGIGWRRILAATPFLAAPILLAPWFARGFDALAFGEAEARHMGVPVEQLKRGAIAAIAVGVGAAVALCGVVGFVGVVVPHAMRLVIGPSHRALLIASALAGAGLTTAADLAARTLVAPAELPIGILTAIVGAPVFLHLVLRRRSGTGA